MKSSSTDATLLMRWNIQNVLQVVPGGQARIVNAYIVLKLPLY
jgi:hypothetical protein